MDGNPEGTPNPLNPTPGIASAGNKPQPSVETAAGTGTIGRAESVTPASFAQSSEPATITGLTADPISTETEPIKAETEPAGASAGSDSINLESDNNPSEPTGLIAKSAPTGPETFKPEPVEPESIKPEPVKPAAPKFTAPRPMPHRGGAVDPMMRRVNKPAMEQVETFEMENETIDELRAPDFVAKDSIVESSKKSGKKKGLIICGIILLMAAIICGAAAIAVAIVNNNGGDRVSKAIEKLVSGNISTIVSAQGKIAVTAEKTFDETNDEPTVYIDEETSGSSTETTTNCVENPTSTNCIVESTDTSVSMGIFPFITNTSIDFDGTFDFASSVNKVTASIVSEYEDGNSFTINVDELGTKDGSVFFKLSGLSDMFGASAGSTGLMSIYKGLFETIDDEWILASGEVEGAVEGLGIFDNNSTCLINAFGTLPQYGKDLANKYKANQFITYSTDNLKISKKKNNLYRLGIDNDKMSAFANSLGNNGFINELNACMGSDATNTAATSGIVKNIFDNFPTTYVEIDENYNFTRVYFEAKNADNTTSSTVKADINLSYPTEFKVTEPTDYLDMSALLSSVMTNFFSTDTVQTTVEQTSGNLPDTF